MPYFWWRGGGGECAGGGREGATKIHFPQQQWELLIHLGRFLAAFGAPTLAWATPPMLLRHHGGIAPFCFSC